MDEKANMIRLLREEFDSWEALLAGLSEEQIVARDLPADLSIKDTMAHLWGWQQLSIARLEAARDDREPEFDLWPADLEPESVEEDNVDQINAWMVETYSAKPWVDVYADWKAGYLQFLALSETTPEADLFDPDRYSWLEGWPLFRVLEGSYEHHHVDHLLPLMEWLQQHGELQP